MLNRKPRLMPMILTDNGLRLKAFDATMSRLLGAYEGEIGANLLVKVGRHQPKRVELWDWFYLLVAVVLGVDPTILEVEN
jgi:hypothetical protein